MKDNILLNKNFFTYDEEKYLDEEFYRIQEKLKPKQRVIILEENLNIIKFDIKIRKNKISNFVDENIKKNIPQNGDVLYHYIYDSKSNLLYIYYIKGGKRIDNLIDYVKELEVTPIQFLIMSVLRNKFKIKDKEIPVLVKINNYYYYLNIENNIIKQSFIVTNEEEILKNIGKDIIIEPFNEKKINPNSYNLSLHNELLVYEDNLLDMKKPNETKKIIIPEDGLILEPGKLYLGRTNEFTKTEKFVPMLEGRSSTGRLGLFIHVTAGFGDIGFAGYWTLEIFCVQPIKVYPNVDICQIYYHDIHGEYDLYNSGKYQNNTGVQPSLMYKDFEK